MATLLLGCAALLGAHSLAFNFVTDDAFISFVYARNLVEHGALVFNVGERVEGYTNFLWTLLLAAGMAVRIAPEVSSRVLGTLGGALTLLVAARAMRRLRGAAAPSPLWDVLPALILAGIPGYACWSSGGLETQLFTLLCTAGATAYLEVHLAAAPAGLGRAGLLVGLAALTRPEGYLLLGLLGLHRLIVKLRAHASLRERLVPTGEELRFVACFLLLTVPHLLWRRSYYGYWVPNTFYIKSSGGAAAWSQGLYYLLAFARDQKLFVLPLLWTVGLARRVDAGAQRRYLALGAVTYLWTAAFLLYVVSVGGDFMGLYRFVLPIVPLNVLCGALGLWRLGAASASPSGSQSAASSGPQPGSSSGTPSGEAPVRGWALGLTALLLGLHAVNTYFVDRHALTFIGADRGIDTPGYLRYYTSDRAAIGKWLGQNVRPDDYQVVGGAGAQVYYAGIRALDSFGLSDAYVAHKVAPVSTRPGHQKFAPLDYVLAQHPTILTYNVYRILDAPYQPSPGEVALWRGHGFHYVSVQIPGLSKPWYSFLKRLDRSLGPLPKADDLD
ncbi:MAG TPA: hypothetical protein PLW65_22330 [Pseudomonadota bacterium]|nr:hypothetical protein [Pseudomonadota bacterium]